VKDTQQMLISSFFIVLIISTIKTAYKHSRYNDQANLLKFDENKQEATKQGKHMLFYFMKGLGDSQHATVSCVANRKRLLLSLRQQDVLLPYV
jgi:hypothetical protein